MAVPPPGGWSGPNPPTPPPNRQPGLNALRDTPDRMQNSLAEL